MKSFKRPAGTAKPKAKSVAKRPAKRPCPSDTDPAEVSELPWTQVKMGLYTKQSYIQVLEDNEWRWLISCSTNMAAKYEGGHQALIKALEPHCHKPGCTKEKMLALRKELLA